MLNKCISEVTMFRCCVQHGQVVKTQYNSVTTNLDDGLHFVDELFARCVRSWSEAYENLDRLLLRGEFSELCKFIAREWLGP